MRLVLLPGLDGTGLLFNPLIDALPPSITPIVIPLSGTVAADYPELLSIVSALLPRHERFVLLGESFSGPLSLLLAAQRPAGLGGVVLCASFISNPTFLPSAAAPLARSWLFRFTPAFVQAKALLGGYSSPALRNLLAQAHHMVAPAVMAQRVRSVLTVEVSSALAGCPVPVAYLRGSHDHVVPSRNLKRISACRPDVRVFRIPAPHLVLQVQPVAAASAISEFIASLPSEEHGAV